MAGVGVMLGDLLDPGERVLHLGVDLTGDEVMRAIGLEQLRKALAVDRQELEDEEGGMYRVGAIEVVEVVMPRDLAAENGVLVAHPGLEEGVADAVNERGAARPITVSGTPRLARTS